MNEMPHLRPIDSDGQQGDQQQPPSFQKDDGQGAYPSQPEPSRHSAPAASGQQQDYARMLIDSCVKFFSSADDVLSRRLAASRTVVHVHLTDANDQGFTVFFDEHPARSEAGYVGNAETHIYSTLQNWTDIILGQEHLGLLIAKGKVEYDGPVRKFMRATPMMRRLDVDFLRPVAQAAREQRKRDKGGQ